MEGDMKKQSLKSFVWELLSKGKVVTDQKVCDFLNGEVPNFRTVEEYKRRYYKALQIKD
jgi:hypothetical protein